MVQAGRGDAAYGADYTFFQKPKIAKVTPPCGPVDQLVQLSVLGEGFTERTPGSIRCKFPLPDRSSNGSNKKGSEPVVRTMTATVVDDDDTEVLLLLLLLLRDGFESSSSPSGSSWSSSRRPPPLPPSSPSSPSSS